MNYIQNFNDNETILRAILGSTTDGMIILDSGFNIIHSNKRFKELWNIPPQLLDEKVGDKLISHMKIQIMDSEKFLYNMSELVKNSVEHIDYFHLKNGRTFEVLFHPLIVDNKASGTVWSFRDITSRIVLEKELRRSQTLYRKLIEQLPDAVLVYKEDKIFLVNNAASRLLKKSKLDIIGKKSGTLAKFHPDYKKTAINIFNKLKQSETTVDFMEQKLILSNGSEVDVEFGGFSFKNDDQFFITSIIRDITERKRINKLEETISEKNKLLKEAKEYNRLKTQLFSTISHELKTPLNIIYSSIQLLEKIYSGASLSKYLNVMRQNCYRLLRLINNFIDINKIEVGFYKLELQNSDIVKTIEDITLSIVDYTKNKGIDLTFDTDIEEKIMAFNADMLERVMLNLLSNAIKFTEIGGSIRVNLYDKGTSIIISVKDSGTGIPENMLSKVFEPFRQVDNSLRRKAEGSGLGLSLVKSLVEMHEGSIYVKSKLGEGSEFIIELPVKLLYDSNKSIKEPVISSENNIERINIEFSDIYSR